jgi:gliding motility-associated-like protein
MDNVYKTSKLMQLAFTVTIICINIINLAAQSGNVLKADFSQDKTNGCLPVIVQFTNQSIGTGLNYFWDFGNGNTSAIENPGAIYTSAGVYTVRLIITNNNGLSDTVVKQATVRAFANPDAAFTANTKGACAGTQIAFSDTSTVASAPIVGWQWNFGDGASTLAKAPHHTFATEGVFSVSLIITDSNGCKSFVNKASYIKTTLPAKVSFTADNTGGCNTPLTVNFTNTSQLQAGQTYTYNWKLGNGDSTSVENPSLTYAQTGNYTVSLQVTDDNNCSVELTNKKFISIGKTKAAFTMDAKNGCVPHTVKFTNTGTGIPSNATVVWYFGNGDSAIGNSPKYKYTQAGTYSVTMAITSPSGCNDVLVKTDSITVLQSPVTVFGHGNPVSCSVPYTLNFHSGNPIAKSWLWDFGNGKTSTQEKPVTTFDSTGVFSVALTITDANGCKGNTVKTNLVRVKTQQAAFTPSVTFGCVPLTVSFTNNSTAFFGIKDFVWDFGNGQTSTTKNPTIVYNNAGIYHPKLIITDNNGCTDTVVYDSIMAGVKTHPDFVASKQQGCKSDMRDVKFTNKTDMKNQKVDAFFWDFGVLTSTLTNPVIDYYQYPSKYTVKLIAVSNGCADTMVKTNYINILMPHAQMKVVEDPCKLDTIRVINASKGGHVFEWTLNSVFYTGDENFNMFLNPGSYELDLHLKDTINGCSDSKSFKFDIHKPLEPGFTQAADSICANLPLLLTDTTKGAIAHDWKISHQPALSGKMVTPSFSNPGKENITLTVTDVYGCKESITKTNTVKILGPDFKAIVTPNEGCFPLDAQLIKTGHSEHGVASAFWSDNNKKVTTMADTVPFTFATSTPEMNKSGVVIYLSVTDNLGCKVVRNTRVKMSKPVAAISNQQDLKCDHTVVKFSHSSPASQHINTLQYQWELEDSATVATKTFTTSFNKAQTAKITLTVTETVLGCTDKTVVQLPIKLKKIQAGFNVDKTHTTCPPLVSTFTDASQTENTAITSAKWWFGDGATSSLAVPVKNYFYPGSFDITYKVTDAQGCTDSVVVKNKIQIGGPTGTYVIDRYKGCVPFTANFTANSQNAKTVNWDLGNGKLNVGANAQGTYVLPGSYKPAMVLEDSFGCLVVYPVKDPIVGYATPVPSFTISGGCANDKFIFNNTTDTTLLPANFVWTLTETTSTNTFNAEKKYGKPGKYNVVLTATAANGCEASNVQIAEIKPLKAGFDISSTQACRATVLYVADKSIAEAGIKHRSWSLGNGNYDSAANLNFEYNAPGKYFIKLTIEDNNGCTDSVIAANPVTVFDTLVPPTPKIHRVTVEQNNTVRLEFAPYCKADFGNYLIYRSLPGKDFELYKTITHQWDTVVIDADVNTFKSSYAYKIFTQTYCGKISADGVSNVHKSILLQTVVDTNIVRVSWNAYEGWEKIDQYQIFRKGPADADYSQFTIVPAYMTSYIDDKAFCGNTYQYLVYAERAAGGIMLSSSNYTSGTPIYKADVHPGRIVRATVEDDEKILIEFAPNYKQKTPVSYYTIEKSVDGMSYSPVYKSTDFTWSYVDEEVSVHSKSYYYRVSTTDVCGDVSQPGNIGKTILLHTLTDNEDNVNVSWSGYQQWEEGIQYYEVQQADANGVFVKVGTNNAADTSFVDASNLFNQIPQVRYRVKAVSNQGVESFSNIDDAKGRSSLFAPNAFTPNGDEHNNKFVVVGAYIKTYEINIYDRYGEKIFTGNNLEESWDGTYKGQPAQDGAYVYVINSLGIDAKFHNLSGTVTLLR